MLTAEKRFVRLRGKERCAICGHVGWCTKSADGTKARCMRTPSDRPTTNGGYIHNIAGAPTPIQEIADAAPLPKRELELLARNYETAINPERLEKFATSMGLSVASLKRLRIGWAHDKAAWAFPMTDYTGGVTGIRLRGQARKWSIRGGHEGLFIPRDLPDAGLLLLCEGPTSCAALLDLEFCAIGRPNNCGGASLVKDYLKSKPRRDVSVFGDHDERKERPDGSVFYPGQDGAEKLAREIVSLCRSVKVIIPPRCKDARDWKRNGATKQVIDAVIRSANYLRREA